VPISPLMVVVDCRDRVVRPSSGRGCWRTRSASATPDEVRVSDPAGAGGSLCFMKVPEPMAGKARLDLDVVTSGSVEDEVTRLVEAGA
jgi:hypothetical protein